MAHASPDQYHGRSMHVLMDPILSSLLVHLSLLLRSFHYQSPVYVQPLHFYPPMTVALRSDQLSLINTNCASDMMAGQK